MKKSMFIRIIFGAIMIAALAGVFFLDGWLEYSHKWPTVSAPSYGQLPLQLIPLTVIVGLLSIAAFLELRRLSAAGGGDLLTISGLWGTLLLATSPFWQPMVAALLPYPLHILYAINWLYLMLFIIVAGAFLEQMIRYRTDGAFRHIGATLLTVLYLGVGSAMLLTIREEFGIEKLVLFLVAVKFADIGAYFVGSAVGRHKLIPWLSPGKSWEGLIGGIVIAAGAAVGIAVIVTLACGEPIPRYALWPTAVFGAIVAVVGQFGDLCESLLKRSAAIKDSGAVVPEFGGVMDIIDSPLIAAPVGYLLLVLFTFV